jgi:hypothetical protein
LKIYLLIKFLLIMKKFTAFARHKIARIVAALIVLLVISGGLYAQTSLFQETAPAESGFVSNDTDMVPIDYYRSDDFKNDVARFIKKESKIHSKSLLGEQFNQCDQLPCGDMLLSFLGAANYPLIPERVIFIDNTTQKAIGGLDSRDFTIGKHTLISLPYGSYTMVVQHHMYEDYIFPELVINDAQAMVYEHNILLQLRTDVSTIYVYPEPEVNTLYAFGNARDVSTGLPLSGVEVSLNIHTETGVRKIGTIARSDENGFFVSNYGLDIKDLIDTLAKDYFAYNPRLELRYHLDGYHETYPPTLPEHSPDLAHLLWPDTDGFDLKVTHVAGIGFMKPVGYELVDYPRTESKKLRTVPDSAEISFLEKSLMACTLPIYIKVGVGCTSCSGCGGCTQFTHNGSPNLPLEAYVKTVLYKEWVPSWANATDGVEALKAGAVAIRSVGVYYVSNPICGSTYHIGGSTCWQAFDGTIYSSVLGNSPIYSAVSNAANATAGFVLKNGSSVAKSEFAKETNNLSSCGSSSGTVSCGDGKFQKSVTGSTSANPACYPTYGIDYVSLGKSWCATGSHPRGMSQMGSMRWASGLSVPSTSNTGTVILPTRHNNIAYCKKSWTQILAHYYPYYTLENCTTGASTNLSSVNQVCGSNLIPSNPTYSRSNRTFTLTGRTQNNGGTAISTQFRSRYYLSTNTTYSSNDILIATFTTSSLSAGATATGSVTTTVSTTTAPAGTYYLIYVVDALGSITETSETDNTYVFTSAISLGTSLMDNTSIHTDTDALASEEDVISTIDQTPNPTAHECTARVIGNSVIITGDNEFTYHIVRSDGALVCNGISTLRESQCDLPTGMFILSVQFPDNSTCIQKITVFD